MRKILLTLVALLSFIGCKPRLPEGANGECTSFWQALKTQWTYNPETTLYKSGNLELELVRRNTCFFGLKPKAVTKLLGHPRVLADGAWYYFFKEVCIKEGLKNINCNAFVVKFDAAGKVKEAEYRMGAGYLN